MTKRAMAAIHAAKRDLKLDDDTYRTMLFNLTKKRSAKDLSQTEIGIVLDHMRSIGAKKPDTKKAGQHPGKPHNFDIHKEMITKIEAQLADMKLPWAYADAIAKRQTGIENIAWVRDEKQLRAVIAALHVEQEKRGLFSSITNMLGKRGITPEEFGAKNKLRKGWQRNRNMLKQISEQLFNEEITREAN